MSALPVSPDATRRRPRWWTQALLVAALLWVYDAINNLSPLHRSAALAHGASLVRIEQRLHLDPELALNHWLAIHVTLGRILGDYYDILHFAVTLGLLGWVWWRHPGRYRLLRNALAGMNIVGFAVFWLFPVAPPRMLVSSGFVDIVAVTHSVGAWSSGALASQANEYAAMPSLHVAWAAWCLLAVWAFRRDVVSRALAVAYVILTSIVVIATANHYLLDVAAGGCTALFVGLVAWGWERRRRPPQVSRPVDTAPRRTPAAVGC